MVGLIKKYYKLFIKVIAILILAADVAYVTYMNISTHVIGKNQYIYPNYRFDNVDFWLLIATTLSIALTVLFAVVLKSKRIIFKIARCTGYFVSVACVLAFGLLFAFAASNNYNSHTVDLNNYLKFDKYLDDSETATFFPKAEYISETVMSGEAEVSYSYILSLPLFVEKSEYEITLKIDYANSDKFEKMKNDLMNANSDILETDEEIVRITLTDAVSVEDGVPLVLYDYIEIDSANKSILFSTEQDYDGVQ